MMTTAPDDNVHALAIEGTFDDCQALVKGMFNHHAFRDRVRLSGVNSINWARIVAQVVYYFTAAVALGAPAPQGRLHGADRQFRRRLCRLCRQAHGPADRSAGGRDQCQRHPGAHAGDRRLRDCAASSRPPRRRWTFRCRRISSGCCSRPADAMPARCARLMASLAQSGRFTVPARCAGGHARADFAADRADEQETAADHPRLAARGRHCADPHTAVALAVAEKETRDPSVPMVVLSTAHPAKFPDAVAGGLRCHAGATGLVVRPAETAERVTVLPADQAAGRDDCIDGVARGARRSCCMSVEVTRLPSGLSVVTDACRIWNRRRSASGSAPAAATKSRTNTASRICSNTWRSRARRGAPRARSPRRSKRSAAISTPRPASRSTGYFARVLKADVPLALDVLSDILCRADLRSGRTCGASRTSSPRKSAPREDTPDDLVFDRLQETAFPDQPIGRSILGTPETVRSFRPRTCALISPRNYRAPDMLVAAAGAVDHEQIVAEAEKRFASFTGPDAPRRKPARFGGGTRGRNPRARAGAYRAGARRRAAGATRQLYSLQVFTSVLGGGMSSRLFQEVREMRGLCYTIQAFHMPYSDTGHVRPLCRHRRGRRAGIDAASSSTRSPTRPRP